MDNPNAEMIQGLREIADWFEQRPGLPKADAAAVSFWTYTANRGEARNLLSLVADALGDRAEEDENGYDAVISGRFTGGVQVRASAKLGTLTDTPLPPAYEPILKSAA